MTTLNSRLQLALIKRKKSKNALQKGFTLVELLIVVVILGILSGVALPNFLNQADKAKANAANTAAKAAASAYAQATITGDETDFLASLPDGVVNGTSTVDGATCVTFTANGANGTEDDGNGNQVAKDPLAIPAVATVCGTGVELTTSASASAG